MFRSLVQDESAPSSSNEAEVDDRLATYLIKMDEPDVMASLGLAHSTGFGLSCVITSRRLVQPSRSDAMVRPCTCLWQYQSGTSRKPYRENWGKLREKFPEEEIPVPSLEWIRLQFWPRNPYASTALKYTGSFNVRYAVQSRQLRHEHPDSKYVAVVLRYAK